jgi:DNA repair protein RecN (Recombination protein N)
VLTRLSIKNYALIEDLTINFSDGLTVITGETGAGKSILIKSIELITGTKTDSSFIRSGCSVCTITACFECKISEVEDFFNNYSIPVENPILVRRIFENSGKSKAFVNDSQVTMSTLASLGRLLLDFHGQDEKYSLLNLNSQLEILDSEVEDIKPLLKKLSLLQKQIESLHEKFEEMNLSESDREKKIDLYSFQIKEIEDARIEINEDVKLETELLKLKNAEKIADLAQRIISTLYFSENAVLNSILEAKKNIEILNSYGVDTSDSMSLIEQAYYQTEEAYREIKVIFSRTEINPEKLNTCIERLELIKKLKKKYGNTLETVIGYRNNIVEELKKLSNYKSDFEKLKKELESQVTHLQIVCEAVSQKRKKAAQIFAQSVQKKLFDLEIKNATFEIVFKQKDPSGNGHDVIEFMFCANKGEKTLPLKTVASGGELSRVLLAIELSSKKKNDRTSIFDEIDVGTGGKTGKRIGEKLAELAQRKQVLSITHLAQVAAFAKTHIKIHKETKNARTYTKIKILTKTERIEEIARMISGETITKGALEHAKDLIAASAKTR